jgi:carbon monoxide dehydrogenase subunit G
VLSCHSERGRTPPTIRGCVLLAGLVLALQCHAAGESAVRSVNVAYDGMTYVCDVLMHAPVPAAVAWEVLTDFEHMAQWVPNVRASRVLKRERNSVTVEQHGLARYGALGFPYTSRRRIEMVEPLTVRSIQVEGSMRRFDSLMTLEPDEKGTRLTYHLEMVPGLVARAVLSRSFLEHELAEQFGAIVGEMVRRAR